MMERRSLHARGLVFDLLAAGDPAGEPVLLLLHGFPQTAACWTELAEALADAGYRVLAPDQRGYSPGARPAAVRDYRMPELVADVLAVADRAGARRFHVVGHDWGGAVAWHLAARHPERVATLTAVSTPHPRALAAALRSSAQPLRSAYIAFFRTPRLPELVLGARGLSGLRLLLARSGLGPEWVEAYAGALAGPGALPAALAWYRATGPSTLRAPEVAVPTCHLWGSGDPALGRRATEATARWVTGPYHLQVLDGAGHWLPEQHAAELADQLLSHLRQWPIGRPGGQGWAP
jgi:pimeloyl-ACP methyl ester carboxylesterase